MMVNSVEIKIVKDFTGLSAKLSSDGEITVEIGTTFLRRLGLCLSKHANQFSTRNFQNKKTLHANFFTCAIKMCLPVQFTPWKIYAVHQQLLG